MGTDCTNCIHFNNTEWSALDQSGRDRLNQVRGRCHYLPGEPIYHEGDEASGAYCISSGLVGIRKVDAEGESVLLRLVRPGETFGFRSFLTGDAHSVSAEALTECHICRVPQGVGQGMAEGCPGLTAKFFAHLARDMRETETKVLETVKAPSRLRFLRLLVAFANPGPNGSCRDTLDEMDECAGECEFELPLSRQDIASMIGVRPESMSRMIRAVQDEGLARFRGRHVEVPDAARLKTESLGEVAF